MAASLTKAQRTALSTMRGILREMRVQYDVEHPSKPGKKDISSFTQYVVQQYRVGSKITDRSRAKVLRNQAADYLELVNAYRGGDPDKQMQRHAAAKYVGLTIPESVPLGRTPLHIAEQYDLSNKLKAMAEGNDLSKLSGLDNIKAQYYGIEAATGIGSILESARQQEKGASGGSKQGGQGGKPSAKEA